MRNHVLTFVALVLCRVTTGWKTTRDVCKTDLVIKNNNVNVSWIYYCHRFRESVGTLNLIHPSVCPSVTKILTLAITFALLHIELWYLTCVFLVTRPFRWYRVVTLTVTFDLLQGQICCRAGDHNSLNVLVYFPLHLRRSEKGGGRQGGGRWGGGRGGLPPVHPSCMY